MSYRVLYGLMLLVAGCAPSVVREGTLANGETYRDFSREPYGYWRVIYGPDGRERERRELHTGENFKRIKPGMTRADIAEVVGPPSRTAQYGNATSSETWRYYDGVYKLLHVIYGADGRVLRYETEWDPNVYSKPK